VFIVKIKPESLLGVTADLLMVPLMFLTQLTFFESLQRTHFWNNYKLSLSETSLLSEKLMVSHNGDYNASIRWLFGVIPIFHIPVLGGWKNYLVIQPVDYEGAWFPGWKTSDVSGVSKVPVMKSVKLLLGPKPVQFFGVDSNGCQIFLTQVGTGTLRKGGLFKRIPLR
jgi:hypothetical protein